MDSIAEFQDRNNLLVSFSSHNWLDVIMVQWILFFFKKKAAKYWIIRESNAKIIEGNHGSGIRGTLENHNCSQESQRPTWDLKPRPIEND